MTHVSEILFLQEKKVNIVAVGIGPGVEEATLHDIAGAGPVVQVEAFDKLDEMMKKIKGSACSGKLSLQKPQSLLLLNPPGLLREKNGSRLSTLWLYLPSLLLVLLLSKLLLLLLFLSLKLWLLAFISSNLLTLVFTEKIFSHTSVTKKQQFVSFSRIKGLVFQVLYTFSNVVCRQECRTLMQCFLKLKKINIYNYCHTAMLTEKLFSYASVTKLSFCVHFAE